MSNLEIIEKLLKKKNFFFGRRMWDNGPEWYVEIWSPKHDMWFESYGKRLSSCLKEIEKEISEHDE